jgi:polar amino acid transport system substrate-binding protein
MKKKIINMFLFFGLLCNQVLAQHLTAFTEQFPPYSYDNRGTIGGIAVDVVRELENRSGLSITINVQSWSHGLRQVQRRDNTLLFSVGRTPEREELFEWIGVVVPFNVSFFAHGTNPPRIDSFNDLLSYRIGVVRGDMRDQFLSKFEGASIRRYSNSERLIRGLVAGQIDLVPVADLNLPFLLSHLDIPRADVSLVYRSPELSSEGLYLVSNLNTNPNIINLLRSTLNDIHESGFIERLYQYYLDAL